MARTKAKPTKGRAAAKSGHKADSAHKGDKPGEKADNAKAGKAQARTSRRQRERQRRADKRDRPELQYQTDAAPDLTAGCAPLPKDMPIQCVMNASQLLRDNNLPNRMGELAQNVWTIAGWAVGQFLAQPGDKNKLAPGVMQAPRFPMTQKDINCLQQGLPLSPDAPQYGVGADAANPAPPDMSGYVGPVNLEAAKQSLSHAATQSQAQMPYRPKSADEHNAWATLRSAVYAPRPFEANTPWLGMLQGWLKWILEHVPSSVPPQ